MSASTGTIPIRGLVRAPVARDGLVALVAFGLTLALLASRGSDASRGLDPLGVVLAAIASFPLLARRRAPLAVFALTTAASATINGLGYAEGPPFGPTIALFFVAADERTRTRLRETAVVLLGMFALHLSVSAIAGSSVGAPILWGIIVWGGAWIAGDQLRQRRQRRAELEERSRRAERELEHERRLAAAEERTRIARDLHDSAAHAINVILVQAGAARLLHHRDPDASEQALSTIEDVARETIGEIDQLIRGLRENSAGSASDVELPTGLAAARTLAQRHRAAGLAVVVTVHGSPRPLAPGLDQAAYRILQESLTNAARHGSGAAAARIDYREGDVELTVSNPVPPEAPDVRIHSGHGIQGMSERAALLGGSLQTRRSGGTFRVHARLPYQAVDER